MDTPKFKQFSVVKNIINKNLGIVLKVIGENVTVYPAKGRDKMTFRSQYLESASQEETSSLKELIEQVKKDESKKPKKTSKKIIDPAHIRYEFDKFLKHIAVRYPVSKEAFKAFWQELLIVAGDIPGKTWEMKSSAGANPGPVLKIYNTATQKWIYCLSFMPERGLRMEIKKEFLPKGFDELFPIDNAMFGAGKAVELNYPDFSLEKKQAYINCVKAIYAAHPEPK
ncbi:MAG: hypothetical protein L6420_02250 [Elusimicrobia bacterium]|nr:hypothetical protein [Elusimicrobiota bacterium]